MNVLRRAACDYADRGWAVLPLRPRRKEPLGRLAPKGKDDATSDLVTVFRWWEKVPAANIGISCGASGMLVLDVDPRHGGDDSLFELELELGRLPSTPRAATGGGGEHYLFRHPGELVVGVLAPGLDVKDAGYIVAPPSVHPSGATYEWDVHPEEVDDLAEVPGGWLERLRQPITPTGRAAAVRVDHSDPLRRILSEVYVERLTGRSVERGGWVRCPFHRGGEERTPSLRVNGTLWACFACDPIAGKRVMGGDLYDLAGLLKGFALPLRGTDYLEIKGWLTRELGS